MAEACIVGSRRENAAEASSDFELSLRSYGLLAGLSLFRDSESDFTVFFSRNVVRPIAIQCAVFEVEPGIDHAEGIEDVFTQEVLHVLTGRFFEDCGQHWIADVVDKAFTRVCGEGNLCHRSGALSIVRFVGI